MHLGSLFRAMNPESPTPREEVEAKLTALLLGELPADEAFALGRTIERDAELARLYSHLKQTIGLLREAAVRPVEQTVAQTSSLKLSDSRREKLLAHFKTVTPKDFAEPKRPAFSWLVPVAAAAAFVAIAGAMLLPALSKAKNKAQSISIISNLRQIDVAKEQWAVENRKSANAEPTMNELKPYLGREIASVAGEKYVVGKVGEPSAADLRAVEPRLSSRTWSLVHSSGRESDQRSRLLADGRRVSAERSGDSVAILPSTEQQPGPVAELPGPAAKTVELAGTSGQSRSGGIVLPSSADFENKQNLSALPIRALRSPAATNAVGALGFAPQGGGGGGGAGGSIGGGGGSLAGGRGGADEKAPVPGQVVSIDEGNAAVARIASMPSSFPIDPTTGLPATSRPVQAVDPKTGLPIVVAEQAWANPPVREALAPGIATTAPGIQSSAPAENEVSQRLYKFAYSKGEVVDKTTEQKIAMDSSSNGKPLTTTYNEPSSDEFQKKSKPAQAGDKGALQLMPSAAPDPARYMPTAEVAVTKAMSMAVASSLPKKVEQEIYLGKALAQVPQAKQAYDADLRKPGPAQLAEAPNARPLDLAALTNIAKSEVLAWSIEAPATLRPPAATEIAQKKVNELLKESESAEAVLVKTNAVALRSAPEPRKELDEPAKPRVVTPAPEPQPEFQVRENAFSTFSMNVSDVSFKLAAASLEKGQMPDVASIRSEEFINAFDYRDPEAIAGVPVAFAWERTRYPFAHNRDLLRFSIKTAAAGRQPGRPLNVVLLLDNSGSMERADRVQIIREALRVLAGQLQSQDKLSVVTFARTARLWVDGVSGDHAGKVAEDLSGLTPQGGTNLEEAMNLAYQTGVA
jgi:hypothetical protein